MPGESRSRSGRVPTRIACRSMVLLGLAARMLAAPPGAEAQVLPGDWYWSAVELYRQGDGEAADAALSELEPSALVEITRRVDQMVARAAECESCDERRQLGEHPVLAAALLHTDRAWAGGRRYADRLEVEAGFAFVRAAAVKGSAPSLSRRWLLAVTLRAHAATDGSLALRWVQEATKRFPDDATFRMVHGALEEAQCGFSSLGVSSPLETRRAGDPRLTSIKRHYNAALRAQPDLHEARLRRGRVRALLRDTGADDDLRTVAEESRDPRLVYLARLFLGRLLEVRGRTDEAASAYRAAAEAFPGRTAHLALGHLFAREAGRPGPARRELEQAVETRHYDTVDPYRDYPWGRSREAAGLLEQLRAEAR